MSAPPLVVITTRLPPAICGVGTHSWRLREHWPNESRPIHFLVVDNAPASGRSDRGDRVVAFANDANTLARELDQIGPADVVLHYAGRAYHRFGFPFWLPRVLARWKRRHPPSRLTLFVHELPGKIPIATRHYWLGELNKLVVRRLAAIADVLVTNTHSHQATLQTISGREDVHLIPISSNIEPLETTSGERRNRTEFVLFGLPFGRLQTLRLFAKEIQAWRASGRLTKLHIIGPDDAALRHDDESDFVVHGVLPPAEISRVMHCVGFALTNASAETWSKSGAFMACAAHGCSPVIAAARPQSVPLIYAVGADEVATIAEDELETRRTELKAWYEQNADWKVTVAKIAALVSPSGTAE